jgi:uncharacterized membrane protein
MATNVIMTLIGVLTIILCTDTLRASWESRSSAVFMLALIGLVLGTVGLVLRVVALTGLSLACS